MNKTKLAVFCALIIALCLQVNIDAMNRGQGRRGQDQKQGEQGQKQESNKRSGQRRNKGGEKGRARRGQGRGRGECKGSSCGMRTRRAVEASAPISTSAAVAAAETANE
jgi:hypothetical protein